MFKSAVSKPTVTWMHTQSHQATSAGEAWVQALITLGSRRKCESMEGKAERTIWLPAHLNHLTRLDHWQPLGQHHSELL